MDYDLEKKLYGIGTEVEEQIAPPSTIATQNPNASGPLTVRDEGIAKNRNAKDIDFVGEGVRVTKEENERLVVRIDKADQNVTERTNGSLVVINQFDAVSELPDGKIAPCNVNGANTEEFFGVALQQILPGAIGTIQYDGEVAGALAGKGFQPEDAAFVSLTNGLLVPPAGIPTVNGTLIYRAGFASGALGVNLVINKKKVARN